MNLLAIAAWAAGLHPDAHMDSWTAMFVDRHVDHGYKDGRLITEIAWVHEGGTLRGYLPDFVWGPAWVLAPALVD